MEESEVPLEEVHEHIHQGAHMSREKWLSWVALSTAVLAALAAIASLLSGGHANEGMIHQIRASDHWSYYQAKGIKASLLGSKMDLLEAMNKPVDPQMGEKMKTYQNEQKEIDEQARAEEEMSKREMEKHEILARSVTLFQIAISIAAISVLTKRRRYWAASIVLGVIGIFFLFSSFLVKG